MSEQDIKIKYNNDTQIADIEFKNNDLVNENGLETAVLMSVFTDKRASEDDPLPDINGDKRGWWGDLTLPESEDAIGSKLWLLERSKTTQRVITKAKKHIRDSLQWMIDDGIAVKIDVEVERITV